MVARTPQGLPHVTRRKGSTSGAALLAGALILSAWILSSRPPITEAPSTGPSQIVAEYDTAPIPVPIEGVPAGTRIRDIRFKTVMFPRHQIPAGALLEIAPFLDGMATAAFPANLPLFRENISIEGFVANPVVEQIPVGMRAMTIRVDATTAVEGWAGSGSLVDVLLVRDKETTVIAERVKILSAERSVSPVEGVSVPSIPSTVTLLVSQEQCLAINTAIPLGRIAFALRNGNDADLWNVRNFDADSLRQGKSANQSRPTVSGYASYSEGSENRAFALADGKWIASSVVPQGFFPRTRENAHVIPGG